MQRDSTRAFHDPITVLYGTGELEPCMLLHPAPEKQANDLLCWLKHLG